MTVVSQLPDRVDIELVAANPCTFTWTGTGVGYSAPVLQVFTEAGKPATITGASIVAIGDQLVVTLPAAGTALLNRSRRTKRYPYSCQAIVSGQGPFEVFAGELVVHPVGTAGVPTDLSAGAQVALGAASTLIFPIHAHGNASTTLTSMPAAATFFGASQRFVLPLDLSRHRQGRLTARTTTGSASPNNPRARLVWRSTYSAVVGDYAQLGVGGTEIAVTVSPTNALVDSGWVDLEPAARTDIVLCCDTIGGDGTASPVLGNLFVHFR